MSTKKAPLRIELIAHSLNCGYTQGLAVSFTRGTELLCRNAVRFDTCNPEEARDALLVMANYIPQKAKELDDGPT